MPLKLCLCLVLSWATTAAAQDLDAGLFHGEAPLAEADAGDHGPALRQALAEVLVKLTGLRRAAQRPEVALALDRAPELARETQVRQRIEGQEYRAWLSVEFDPAGVRALLDELGLAIWPQPRPAPVLWLAIDDGRGPRLVTVSQGAAVASLRDRAQARGLRVVLPEGSPEDVNFGVQAAWREDAEAAEMLRGRYPGAVQLLGRLYRGGGGWRADWTLLEHGQPLRSWSADDGDARALLAAAAEETADVLAERFAALRATGPPGVFTVRVEGLESADDYPRLMAYLGQLGPVRRASPILADSDGLLLELDLAIGLEGFVRLVEAGPQLSPVDRAGAMRVFRLRP